MPSPVPSFASATYNPDRLIVGEDSITQEATLVSGQNTVRGAVLGKITTGGKYALSLSGASDGSEVPRAILAHDMDASGGDKLVQVFVSGEFDQDRLTLGTAHTVATVKEALRAVGIIIKDPISDLGA